MDVSQPMERTFTFTVTRNGVTLAEFRGDNEDLCVDVDIGPGEYAVTETKTSRPPPGSIFIEQPASECIQEDEDTATGEIEEAGDVDECRFVNGLPTD
jgi:hypothetical protein